MTTTKVWTIDAIRQAMQAAGSHWWDRDTMRFFKCRVSGGVFQGDGGVFFVTSEQGPHGPRAYTVRSFDPATSEIDTVGEFNAIKLLATAKRRAQAAAGAPESIEPPIVEPTAAEEFARILSTHGACACSPTMAAFLIRLAKRHHNYCEDACNTPGRQIFGENDEKAKWAETLEVRIMKAANEIGARGVLFDYDPRGCTVKIVCTNGFNNDWSKEGVCVPIFAD